VLLADPDNHEALITLLLALTDQFTESNGVGIERPKEVLIRLWDPYEQHYYAGIIYERWARALRAQAVPVHVTLGWVREAMRAYEQAAALSPPGNEDAILRWNACVRMFQEDERRESVSAHISMTSAPDLDDETPMR
jgi:hypothetical protein